MAPSDKRVIKCRFCDFSTQKKDESYDHLRAHYKPEKLHSCKFDNCNFVTIHKHHYKYHESTHTGYKPVECPLCSYRCVNQSMLTSHMRSHPGHNEYKFSKYQTSPMSMTQVSESGDFILDLRVESKIRQDPMNFSQNF